MCDWCYRGKDIKDSYPSVDDWEDQPYRHHPRKGKSKRVVARQPKGCSANDGGEHVYLIFRINMIIAGYRRKSMTREIYPVRIPETRYVKFCVGCGRVKKSWYIWDEDPVGRYFNESEIYQTINLHTPIGYTDIADISRKIVADNIN